MSSSDQPVRVVQMAEPRLQALLHTLTGPLMQGGVLLGEDRTRIGRPCTEVHDFLPADLARATENSITFTHETWRAWATEANAREDQIIGWYITGTSARLSKANRSLHATFFTRPIQIVLVVDPATHVNQFYGWQSGNIEPLLWERR